MLTSITCPTCDAAYRVPTDAVGAGRTVRCRRCLSEWFATAQDRPETIPEPEAGAPDERTPEPAPEPLPEPLPEPILSLDEAGALDVVDHPGPAAPITVDAPQAASRRRGWRSHPSARPAAARPRRPAPTRRPRASTLVVVAGVAALGLLVGARVEIVRAVPSLASLYGAVGLPVNVRGLEIRDVRSSEEIVDGAPLLVVTGLVENVSDAALEVPRLRLAVTARADREVYAWTTVAARPKLQPGETATFRARLASPPAEGRAITVRFLAKRDLMAALRR